jgi:acetyltransferase
MSTSTATPNQPTGLPIRYPTALIDARCLGGAQALLLRPVLPQDEGLLSAFLQAQSAAARRNRFHAALNPSPRLCRQMSQVDYRRQLALVVCSLANGAEQLVAEARYCVTDDGRSAEFALMVDERWQRQGVGGWALRALKQAAARAGVARLEGEVLHDNQPMLGLARRCGFACSPDPQDERLVRVRCRLAAVDASAAGASSVMRPPGLLRRMGRALSGQSRALTRSPLAR